MSTDRQTDRQTDMDIGYIQTNEQKGESITLEQSIDTRDHQYLYLPLFVAVVFVHFIYSWHSWIISMYQNIFFIHNFVLS